MYEFRFVVLWFVVLCGLSCMDNSLNSNATHTCYTNQRNSRNFELLLVALILCYEHGGSDVGLSENANSDFYASLSCYSTWLWT